MTSTPRFAGHEEFAQKQRRCGTIAAQIGHTSQSSTFSVYQQVATRRYIDEEAVWTLMRFADEPAERLPSRQITRATSDDSRGSFRAERGELDHELGELGDADGEREAG